MNDDNDKHMDKDEDVKNDCHMSPNYLPSFFEDQAHRNSFQDIILPNLRICASFAVTGVTGFTSTDVRANGILAERFHVTNGW